MTNQVRSPSKLNVNVIQFTLQKIAYELEFKLNEHIKNDLKKNVDQTQLLSSETITDEV